MEVTKRTYQKHKTEKKITVKHYLNRSLVLDTIDFGGVQTDIYVIYVLVTYNRRNTKFRSLLPTGIDNGVPDKSFSYDLFANPNPNMLKVRIIPLMLEINGKAFVRDRDYITWLVSCSVEVNGDDFNISDLSVLYHNKVFELSFFVEWALRNELRSAILDIQPDKWLWDLEYENSVLALTNKVYDDVSALQNLEFSAIEFPKVKRLRKEYSSQIWFLGIYLQKVCDGVIAPPMYSYLSTLSRPSTMDVPLSVDISQKPSTQKAFEVGLTPTLFDFSTQSFQSKFVNYFENETDIENIIEDIDKLYAKYYEKFKTTFFKKHK